MTLACFTDACAEELLPVTLEGVRRCPTPGRSTSNCASVRRKARVSWCFPRHARRREGAASPIALTLGPYGVLARRVLGRGFGAALDDSAALPMILAGAEVVIAGRLVTAGR
jgi:hypothetical protein